MTDRRSFPRALAIVVGLALAILGTLMYATTVAATKPNPDHKVTICHAHPADTAAAGFAGITVDVASVGYVQAGHQSEHDADIIPAYEYTDVNGVTFSFPGKNLGTLFFGTTGLTILNNGCQLLDPGTPTPTPSQSIDEPSTGTPDPSVEDLPNGAMSENGHLTGEGLLVVYAVLMAVMLGAGVLTALDSRR